MRYGRILGAFLLRDWRTEVSYRLAFLGSLSGVVLNTVTFYFVAQLVQSATLTSLLPEAAGNYFAFVLIGIAFGAYFGVGLRSFAAALRHAQVSGTLEAMIMTPTPVSLLIVGSALWSYAFTTLRVGVYLGLGVLLGLPLQQANYLGALATLGLAIVAFAALGILAASVILVIKRGEPVTLVFSGLANLVGGVFYPIEGLPSWLQEVSQVLPITYALRAMRLALLTGAGWRELAPDLLVLALFGSVLLPLALMSFRLALERARLDGSLAHY